MNQKLCNGKKDIFICPKTRKELLNKMDECTYEGITLESNKGDCSIQEDKFIECNGIKYYYNKRVKGAEHFSDELCIKLVKFCYCEALDGEDYCENHLYQGVSIPVRKVDV